MKAAVIDASVVAAAFFPGDAQQGGTDVAGSGCRPLRTRLGLPRSRQRHLETPLPGRNRPHGRGQTLQRR